MSTSTAGIPHEYADLVSWSFLLSIPILFLSSYFFTTTLVKQQYPRLRNRKICLLIAHPDDEAMFFSPMVTALTNPELGNHLKILCLSNGNAEGLGEIRSKELTKSAILLGVRSEIDILVINNNQDFPDSMTVDWSPQKISALLVSAFIPQGMASANAAPIATIDTLITFDAFGVSDHTNHKALHGGATLFLQQLLKHRTGYASPVDLFTLTSLPIWRKYLGLLDLIFSIITIAFARQIKGRSSAPARLVFVADVQEVLRGWKAMVIGHVSQMRWFRWGWILGSRYMYINDLKLVRV